MEQIWCTSIRAESFKLWFIVYWVRVFENPVETVSSIEFPWPYWSSLPVYPAAIQVILAEEAFHHCKIRLFHPEMMLNDLTIKFWNNARIPSSKKFQLAFLLLNFIEKPPLILDLSTLVFMLFLDISLAYPKFAYLPRPWTLWVTAERPLKRLRKLEAKHQKGTICQ